MAKNAKPQKPSEVKLVSRTIDCPLDTAYEFAHQPENFPKWAAGMSFSLHRDGNRWIAQAPQGEAIVEFSPPNKFGILDHWVTLPDQPVIYISIRLIANGDGTEVVFTLFRQPSMDDAAFDKDAQMVEKDLSKPQEILEALRAKR